MQLVYLILLVLSLYLTMLAGTADVENRRTVSFRMGKRTYHVTKEHLWHDAPYILVLLIVFKFVF